MIARPETYRVIATCQDGTEKYVNVIIPVKKEWCQIYPVGHDIDEDTVRNTVSKLLYNNNYRSWTQPQGVVYIWEEGDSN